MVVQCTQKLLRAVQYLPKRFCSSGSGSMVNLSINEKTGYATMEMNRPPVNGLNLDHLQQLDQKLDQLTSEPIRGLILTSSSNKVFCAGLDLMELYKPNFERLEKVYIALQDVWYKFYGTNYPTAAAINGHSPAGGCMLALTCEYRVMCEYLTIGLNETRVGMEAPPWLKATMLNVLSRRDSEMALTLGTMFTTDEALKIKLIDETANSKEDAIKKCEKWLDQFKTISQDARTKTKLALRGRDIDDFHRTRDKDVKRFLSVVGQKSFQDGLEVYLYSLKKKK